MRKIGIVSAVAAAAGPGYRGEGPAGLFIDLETAYRTKSTTAALRSTFVVRLPAPIHADACTWLPDRSFAHQGRQRRAEAGSGPPMIRSISPNERLITGSVRS